LDLQRKCFFNRAVRADIESALWKQGVMEDFIGGSYAGNNLLNLREVVLGQAEPEVLFRCLQA
jgi:hypothetical protein